MITNQVLRTKLYPPSPRSYLVSRPRLVDRINTGLQAGRQLTLVSAAAGFGKTTLAGEWIAESRLDGAVAWFSLDSEDNDPARFLLYLISALQQVDAEIGRNILQIMQSPQSASYGELAEQLINQIAASEKNVLLMLDDYHLITSDAVHHIVQRMIERQPGQMHMVILTREDPPFPIPRMRVRGQVTEVRERDLRFTLEEARSFLVDMMGLGLSAVEVGKLIERTEGWAAGMQLAALALEDHAGEDDRRIFIDAFTGSDRYIVDYLVSEVLERQAEPVREFLLSASILDRFCGDLCDDVIYDQAEPGRSQRILAGLEQGNMFLVSLDNQRQWYRFHHLFAEMLYHNLRRTRLDLIPVLYRRASQWFDARGDVSEAVKYALMTKDWNYAASFLNRYAMRMLFQGQVSMVIGWCQSFPKAFLERSPVVCIYYAWALVLTFRYDYLDVVEETLQMAENAIAGLPCSDCDQEARYGEISLSNWVTGQACVVRSQILLGRFHTYVDPHELIALSLKGLDLVPETEKGTRAICKINLAHAQSIQNDPVEAHKAFDESLPYMLEARNYLGGVTCIFYRARQEFYTGNLDQAERLCQQWKEKFNEISGLHGGDIPTTRGLDIVQGIILMERSRFDEAEKLFVQALDLPGWASWMELIGYIALSRLYYIRGDRARANETIRRMANMGPQHATCAEALQILFEIQSSPADRNLRARAEAWAKMNAPDLSAPFALGIGPYHCDVEYFTNVAWAKLQLSLGQPQLALVFIAPALKSAREHQLAFRILELTVLNALANERLGDQSSALNMLETALGIAERHGYMRVFEEVPHLEPLLKKALERNLHPALVQRILASIDSLPGSEAIPGAAIPKKISHFPWDEEMPTAEPVSDREMEVLCLIARGLSNNQIAERLVIAEGTVKRHITNLYGKLGVQTRTQALAKAREIGLLL